MNKDIKRIEQIMDERDKRYEMRFHTSENAVNAALASQKLSAEAALNAANQAVSKAELAAEKRFESVNEFRKTLSDQQTTFMPRGEIAAIIQALTEKIDGNQLTAETKSASNRQIYDQAYERISTAISELRIAQTNLLSTANYEKRHEELQRQVNELREYRSTLQGSRTGSHSVWGYMVGASGALVALISIALSILFHYIK